MKNWKINRGLKPFTKGNWEVTNGEVSYWFETEEWAKFFMDHCKRLDIAAFGEPSFTGLTIQDSERIAIQNGEYMTVGAINITDSLHIGKSSGEWTCHLFGSEEFKWVPNKNNVPNWFWRKMQYLFFGNRWVKK